MSYFIFTNSFILFIIDDFFLKSEMLKAISYFMLFKVCPEFLQELFSEVGDLKRYTIHYDRSGRSKVSCQVGRILVLLIRIFCLAVV